MKIIAPSLLACDFLNIESELKSLEGIEGLWLHLDIMDGHFVPNLTFGHPIVELIAKRTKIPLDAHFMVTNPEFYIDTFKDYKLTNFTFHLEASDNCLALVQKAKSFYPSVGISIKPNTPASALSLDLLKAVDLVLVMTVEPGFGGQKFMPDCAEKIGYLNDIRQRNNLKFQIQVDGGINNETAKTCLNYGVDNMVAGSHIFKQPSDLYQETINKLREV
ncbi:MAG: ribulose-phosphate 3-epimerase [Bdellovibrio sp. CG12_big_fil_rev_8_21_14_0_65_39_13]|nr:MAG: ribulose-phosphate 3-epimerase [Bdellovibrio sp. CG22_combo_CG10-13_8_21_14_all_39_27]PIQ60720.1 MAG: ribulose-phosphate 3-epimerase [Bdellovibrio sp. CG12_big_fil_rev_8_21_14_0_65_39_13]PIR36344.1 MAG: ribulose-phosphate 3-epimerase [Bdellovibrio sp. CG11_big_fil_rev_8_21_14_0_20_39_38]PJB54227.1 MAG: ribulose-phosphate 3-epimerase [Bdellovibrio sp. CG_4_9_14_3_um_filter_39_7]